MTPSTPRHGSTDHAVQDGLVVELELARQLYRRAREARETHQDLRVVRDRYYAAEDAAFARALQAQRQVLQARAWATSSRCSAWSFDPGDGDAA